jgi:hypothetical protein
VLGSFEDVGVLSVLRDWGYEGYEGDDTDSSGWAGEKWVSSNNVNFEETDGTDTPITRAFEILIGIPRASG